MTIPAGNSISRWTGNGTADTFDYEFKISAAEDLLVTVYDADNVATELTLEADYTVAGVGNDKGSITLTDGPLDSGKDIVLKDNVEASQLIPFGNQSRFAARTHESAFDKNVRLVKRVLTTQERTLKMPSNLTGFDMDFPSPVAGASVRFNAAASALETFNPTFSDVTGPTHSHFMEYTDGPSGSGISGSDLADVLGINLLAGDLIRTDHYGSSRVAGSGGVFQFTGTTTAGKAGNAPDLDGYFYDGAGNQFRVVGRPSVLMYGARDGADSQDALIAAMAQNTDLDWPDGIYTSTDNLPNLHQVRHYGSGRISRNGNVFSLNLPPDQTNSLFCSPATGSDSNDGLSDSEPTATRSRLFEIFKSYGESLGSWDLYFGSGMTQERFTTDGVTAVGSVNCYGPDVAGGEPTAILDGDGTLSPSSFGPYGRWNLYDITFQNFDGHGVVNRSFTRSTYWNCRGLNNGNSGVNAETLCRLYIYGGRYEGNDYGARIYSGSTGSIRQDSRHGQNPQFDNNNLHGLQIRESSNVRADDFSCDGNGQSSVSIEGSSRAHLVNATLDNSPTGVLVRRNSSWFEDGVTYGAGIDTPYQNLSGSMEIDSSLWLTPRLRLFSSPTNVTGSTDPQLVESMTIPARYLDSGNKMIKIRCAGSADLASGAGATINFGYGGATLTSRNFPSSTTNPFSCEFVLLASGPSQQVINGGLTVRGGDVDFARVERAANTAPEKDLSLTVELNDATDSVLIDYVEFEYMG